MYMFGTVSTQIRKFEKIYNGLEEALIDVTNIRKVKGGFLCSITVYDDDFSNKAVYQNVLYPLNISKSI